MTDFLLKLITAGVSILMLADPAPLLGQVFGPPPPTRTLSFGGSVDVASRYVWRGLDLSDDVNIQPAAWLAWGEVEIGTWGSHALEDGYNEQDFWLTYYLPGSSAGAFAISITDYYVSSDFGNDLFDFEGVRACQPGEPGYGRPPRCSGGPHTAEVVGSFTSAIAPFDLLVGYNFHNDPEDSVYGQAAYRPSVEGFDLAFTVGGVFNESRLYYGTDGPALINLSAGVGRTVVALPFEIPLAVEVIHNPNVGETYFVARAGLAAQR